MSLKDHRERTDTKHQVELTALSSNLAAVRQQLGSSKQKIDFSDAKIKGSNEQIKGACACVYNRALALFTFSMVTPEIFGG